MPTMILLAASEADQVRGPSASRPQFAALQPLPLTDGRFYLPAAVLTDPDHASHWALLSTLPTTDYGAIAALLPAEKT